MRVPEPSFEPQLQPGPAAPLFGAPLPPVPGRAQELLDVATWLRSVAVDWRRLAPILAFDPAGYRRRRIAVEQGWELVVCTWLPGQATPVHGHGRSIGVVRVLTGLLGETHFARGWRRLREERSRVIGSGGILLEDRGVIHRVENAGADPAISLHLYAPPLEPQQMGVLH